MDKIWIPVIVGAVVVMLFGVYTFSQHLMDENKTKIITTAQPVTPNKNRTTILTSGLLPHYDLPQNLIYGSDLIFKITVENLGQKPATEVKASIGSTNFSSGVSKTIERLEPGAQTLFELSVPLQKFELGWQSFSFSLVCNEFEPINRAFDVKLLPNPDAELYIGISKALKAKPGEEWRLKVNFENTGKVRLTNIIAELLTEAGIETKKIEKEELGVGEGMSTELNPLVNPNAIPGVYHVRFIVSSEQTKSQTTEFNVTVGA